MTMDMMGSQQYYQIFEDSYGRIANGNNPNVAGIPTTINKGMLGHPPSPLGVNSKISNEIFEQKSVLQRSYQYSATLVVRKVLGHG